MTTFTNVSFVANTGQDFTATCPSGGYALGWGFSQSASLMPSDAYPTSLGAWSFDFTSTTTTVVASLSIFLTCETPN